MKNQNNKNNNKELSTVLNNLKVGDIIKYKNGTYLLLINIDKNNNNRPTLFKLQWDQFFNFFHSINELEVEKIFSSTIKNENIPQLQKLEKFKEFAINNLLNNQLYPVKKKPQQTTNKKPSKRDIGIMQAMLTLYKEIGKQKGYNLDSFVKDASGNCYLCDETTVIKDTTIGEWNQKPSTIGADMFKLPEPLTHIEFSDLKPYNYLKSKIHE